MTGSASGLLEIILSSLFGMKKDLLRVQYLSFELEKT